MDGWKGGEMEVWMEGGREKGKKEEGRDEEKRKEAEREGGR